MRLAVISDVHGNLVGLEAVLADLRRRGYDAIVNCGDCVTSPLWPRESLELLASVGAPTVRGNHDRWVATRPYAEMTPSMRFAHDALTPAQRASLGALPATLEPMPGVLAVHGTPASDVEYLLEEEVEGRLRLVNEAQLAARLGAHQPELVLCGHSHLQNLSRAGRTLVLNPGTVGCPRSVDNVDPAANEAVAPHARYAIATRGASGWSVELFAIAYDFGAVAARARANGREDWARAFS
jgi:predicted phosphodiesterase